MKRPLSILAVFALAFNYYVPPVMAAKPFERSVNSSVVVHLKVVEKDDKGKVSRSYGGCSGTFVTQNLILTAAHCFAQPGNITIWARGPNERHGYPCHLIIFNRGQDLALLEAPFRHPYVRLGNTPRRGDRVFSIGSPYNFEFVPSEGIVGAVAHTIKGFGAKFIVSTTMANPGSSGGGLFNQSGELIGVTSMTVGFFGWQGLSLAVNTETVKQFMATALKYYSPREND